MFREFWESLSFWKKIKLILIIIISVLLLVFSFQNWVIGELRLVFFRIKIPITLIIAVTFFIGYSLALVANFKNLNDKEKEIKKLKNKIKDLENQNSNINN